MTTKTARHLRRAKRLINTPEKWSARPSKCLARLIDEASDLKWQEHEAACVALEVAAGAQEIGLVAWSADPARTHAEVMEAFDRAIFATKPPSIFADPIVTPAIVATVMLAAWLLLYVALAIFGGGK